MMTLLVAALYLAPVVGLILAAIICAALVYLAVLEVRAFRVRLAERSAAPAIASSARALS